MVTHYHADHANGIPQLLRRIGVGEIALPDVEKDSPLPAARGIQTGRRPFPRIDTSNRA